jgi:hypothetical protein
LMSASSTASPAESVALTRMLTAPPAAARRCLVVRRIIAARRPTYRRRVPGGTAVGTGPHRQAGDRGGCGDRLVVRRDPDLVGTRRGHPVGQVHRGVIPQEDQRIRATRVGGHAEPGRQAHRADGRGVLGGVRRGPVSRYRAGALGQFLVGVRQGIAGPRGVDGGATAWSTSAVTVVAPATVTCGTTTFTTCAALSM